MYRKKGAEYMCQNKQPCENTLWGSLDLMATGVVMHWQNPLRIW